MEVDIGHNRVDAIPCSSRRRIVRSLTIVDLIREQLYRTQIDIVVIADVDRVNSIFAVVRRSSDVPALFQGRRPLRRGCAVDLRARRLGAEESAVARTEQMVRIETLDVCGNLLDPGRDRSGIAGRGGTGSRGTLAARIIGELPGEQRRMALESWDYEAEPFLAGDKVTAYQILKGIPVEGKN